MECHDVCLMLRILQHIKSLASTDKLFLVKLSLLNASSWRPGFATAAQLHTEPAFLHPPPVPPIHPPLSPPPPLCPPCLARSSNSPLMPSDPIITSLPLLPPHSPTVEPV